MRFEVHHRPAYALATVHLDVGETVVAEGGAMVSMDPHVAIETSAAGKGQGLIGGLVSGIRRAFAGESFFQNRFTAEGAPGHVTFAPTHVGDIQVHELGGGGLVMQSTAFLCAAESVTLDAKWGGARSFFGGEGLVMLKATGVGPIAFNAFGGIHAIDVEGTFVVDTGHIVAFEDTLQFHVRRFGGRFRTFLLSGEGLVCHFQGRGRLWIQTRNPIGFGRAIGPLLPMRN